MLFAFIEDGTLAILAGADEARRDYEGIDVESGCVTFYDEDGRLLEPVFSVPNRTRRFLGLTLVSSGVFELVPSPSPGKEPLWLALREVGQLLPNPWFETLADVVAHLRARGAEVDAPASGTERRV